MVVICSSNSKTMLVCIESFTENDKLLKRICLFFLTQESKMNLLILLKLKLIPQNFPCIYKI